MEGEMAIKPNILIVSLQKYGAGPADSLGLSEALCNLKIKHSIIVSDANELKDRWKNNEYRNVIFIPTYQSRVFNFIAATIFLVRPIVLFLTVFRQKPQVVHITHFHPWIPLVLAASRICGAKFIYTLHDNPFLPKERGIFGKANRFEKFLASKAHAVVTHSNFVKKAIETALSGKIIEVIPLGAYTHLCPDQTSFKRSDKIHFLFLGRIEPFKGLDLLVSAYRILHQRLPEARLTIAGKGEISLDLRAKIDSLGINLVNRWIKPEETCQFMADADIAVLPYHNATQSGVISLAMAYGIPVIASRVGGLSEQVIDGKTGFLVNPGSIEDLASKMEILATDKKLREEFSKNQYLLAKTTFSWDNSAKILLSLIDDLMAK